MKFGIHVGHLAGPLDEVRRLWRFADEREFDWFSVSDHFQESPGRGGDGDCYEAVAVLAAASGETHRVRLGCLVFCVGYRHPGLLAKSVTAIDHLSSGRFECGIGAGWHKEEFAAYGLPFPDVRVREDQLEEYAQILRLLFDESRTDFVGRHYTLRAAPNNPKPLQTHLPLWIGGGGEKRTLRSAARFGDVWNVPYLPPDHWRRKNQVLDDWCARVGRDGTTVARTANAGFYMAVDGRGVLRQEERLQREWLSEADRGRAGSITGTVQEAIERVADYEAAGVQQLNIAVRGGPYEWESLNAFADLVMPQFRRNPASASG